MNEPNYSNYSLEYLYDALDHIDAANFPERKIKIENEIKKRSLEIEKSLNNDIEKMKEESIMKVICPKCKSQLQSENINASDNVAHCKSCGEIFKLSELISSGTPDNFDINMPPKGAWFFQELDEVKIGASTKSPIAFFIVPFMIVWAGGSIGGLYGSQIMSGEFNLLKSIFGLPFLLGSIIFGSFAVMTVAGKVEVVVSNNICKIFVGVGNLGWIRTIDWNDVRIIREEKSLFSYPGSSTGGIVLEGKTRIKFGSNLNEKRRYFVLNALKKQKNIY